MAPLGNPPPLTDAGTESDLRYSQKGPGAHVFVCARARRPPVCLVRRFPLQQGGGSPPQLNKLITKLLKGC